MSQPQALFAAPAGWCVPLAGDWVGALARARGHSPFLARLLATREGLAERLAAGELPAWPDFAAMVEGDTAKALRLARADIAAGVAIADLAGALPLAGVVAALSAFADGAIDVAIRAAIAARVPEAGPAGFVAMALGKLGAGELNYSSDVDLILLHDPARLARRGRDDPDEAAERVARRMVALLSEVSAEGYVQRVDLRLRPASEISPLALPVEAALQHYESAALTWERAAWIRARAAAGDRAMGEDFARTIRPFVWRRSLDFGAIEEIGRLVGRIRSHYAAGQAVGPGFDLKRGRGGIREVEFFAQTHQLIHGGRAPGLRQRGTRAALDALAAAGIIAADDATTLGAAYDRLRTLEHRVQMIADQQTHALPRDASALEAVARLDGAGSGAALLAEVAALSEMVARRFDALLALYAPRGAVAPPAKADDALAARLGLADAPALARRIAGWSGGQWRALRSEPARAALARIEPALLAALAAAPDPPRALARWEHVLAGLPSAINVFRLFEARPALLDVVTTVLTHAPVLADELARRADLMDVLLDHPAVTLPGSVEELTARLARGEAGDDYQRVLDRVRRDVGEWRFALGVQLVTGAADPLAISAALARLAEAAIAVLTQATIAEFARVHGTVPGARMVICGLGRLGGGALTHASDLDLVFLFAGADDDAALARESDGARPLGCTLYFNRLAQRVGAALSVPTAAGALYEVDTRLRPQGAKGPLAVSLASFARYQREAAWTWEHMALCRARAVYGAPEDRAALDALIGEVLAAPRDAAQLRADALTMRTTMARHKPAKGPLDVKLARGGLVDLEFLIHTAQLSGHPQALTPSLPDALDRLIAAGVLPPALAPALALLSRLMVVVRLVAPDGAWPPEASRALVAEACGLPDWAGLLDALTASRHEVADVWARYFGETVEIEP